MMLESDRCIECGVDTKKEGYVNRVSYGTATVDAYKCGPCMDTQDGLQLHDQEGNFDGVDEDKYDEYLAERIKYIDAKYPEAKKFREEVNDAEV
tara:strand:+ start:772 stop:1053 length:282 start_codon:yes stop_codon:yes gene_type:complete